MRVEVIKLDGKEDKEQCSDIRGFSYLAVDLSVRPQRRCWGLVLKCYELRTRQHKMLNINALRPLKHYFPRDVLRTKVIMVEL
jgi:hypothetical protein